MPAGATYEPIATNTLGSATNSVTFSSIPSTYTDIVIIINGSTTSSSGTNIQFNSDTGTNYSRTAVYATGSIAGSVGAGNGALISAGSFSTSQSVCRINVMNYANTANYKTTISRTDAASEELSAIVGLWRSTAAINTIKISADGGINYNTGTTFTLYGIKAA
jgi:hypothetical protein